MASFLVSLLASFLPKRYWRFVPGCDPLDMRWAAAVSGFLQCLACFLIFFLRYLSFFQRRVGGIGEAAIARGAEEALQYPMAQYGMGFAATLEYLFHPLTLALIYFTLEGGVRVLAALVTEEAVGTLPLYVVAWLEERAGKARAERALGPRVADLIERTEGADYQLSIATCRTKTTWHRLMTIAYEGQFYRVVAEGEGVPPRRFVYRLQKIPPGWVVRGIHNYHPDEVLREEEKPPTFLSRLAARLGEQVERRRVRQEPRLLDHVDRLSGKHYDLRIASCRPKPGWDRLITVEYEGEFYEVAGEELAAPPHRFVYLLRRIPPGKIIRTLHHYRPEEAPLEES